MKPVYRLSVSPGEFDPEGADLDEWFSSLREAKARRAALIAADPHGKQARTWKDFAIWKVTLAMLPEKALTLAILNREGFILRQEQIWDAYVFPPKPDED